MKGKMKAKVILITAILLQPINAFANECENGCYSYYDAQQRKNIEIPFTKEDSEAHANWYQSIVGIPVWNAPLMGDGSKPIPPAGPWVTSDMLPKTPIPYKSIEQYKQGTPQTISQQVIQATPVQQSVIEQTPWVSPVIQYPTIITQTPIVASVNTPQQISADRLLKIKKKIARLNKKLK